MNFRPKKILLHPKAARKMTPLYHRALDQFVKNPLPGSREEKIHAPVLSFTLKVNEKIRMLIVPHPDDEQVGLCIKIMEEHEYQELKGKPKSWYAQQIEKTTEVAMELPELEEKLAEATPPVPLLPLETASNIEFYNQQFIFLSDEQQEVKKQSLPLIISGAPGSGKSALLISILKDQVLRAPHQKYLVITELEQLIGVLKAEWEALCEMEGITESEVEFKTPNQLHGVKKKLDQTGLAIFTDWFEAYREGLKESDNALAAALASFSEEPALLYAEFAAMSGYDNLAEYNSEVPCSLYFLHQRKTVWNLFHNYLSFLEKNPQHTDLYFEPIPNLNCDVCLVDECLDLSRVQLKSFGPNTLFCVGDHQQLFGSESIVPFIHSFYWKRDSRIEVTHRSLSASYRCGAHIIDFANFFLDLKYFLIGGRKLRASHQIDYVQPAPGMGAGKLVWLKDEKALVPLIEDTENAGLAVVVSPGFLEKAQALFGKEKTFLPKDIKGLQYDRILLYCVLPEDYQAIEPLIREFSKGASVASEPSLRHGLLCNIPFVSLTRAIDSVYVYFPEGQYHNLAQQIRNFIEKIEKDTPVEPYKQTVSSPEEWQARQEQLAKLGLAQASAIEDRIRSKSKMSFDAEHKPSMIEQKTEPPTRPLVTERIEVPPKKDLTPPKNPKRTHSNKQAQEFIELKQQIQTAQDEKKKKQPIVINEKQNQQAQDRLREIIGDKEALIREIPLLLSSGVDLNKLLFVVKEREMPVISYAFFTVEAQKKMEIIKTLIDLGAVINNHNLQGTVLEHAYSSNSDIKDSVFNQLLSWGADPYIDGGKGPLLFQVLDSENLDLLELFYEKGVIFDEYSVFHTVHFDKKEALEFLLEKQAYISNPIWAPDKLIKENTWEYLLFKYQSAEYYARALNNKKLIKVFLDYKEDLVNKAGESNARALAALLLHPEATTLLLRKTKNNVRLLTYLLKNQSVLSLTAQDLGMDPRNKESVYLLLDKMKKMPELSQLCPLIQNGLYQGAHRASKEYQCALLRQNESDPVKKQELKQEPLPEPESSSSTAELLSQLTPEERAEFMGLLASLKKTSKKPAPKILSASSNPQDPLEKIKSIIKDEEALKRELPLLIETGFDLNESFVSTSLGPVSVLYYAYLKTKDSPLMLNILKTLLSFKADINKLPTETGKTSVLGHAYQGYQNTKNSLIVEQLLALGADPNRAHPGIESPVLTAVREGDIKMLQLFSDKGAVFDADSVYHAVSYRQTEVLKFLLDKQVYLNNYYTKQDGFIPYPNSVQYFKSNKKGCRSYNPTLSAINPIDLAKQLGFKETLEVFSNHKEELIAQAIQLHHPSIKALLLHPEAIELLSKKVEGTLVLEHLTRKEGLLSALVSNLGKEPRDKQILLKLGGLIGSTPAFTHLHLSFKKMMLQNKVAPAASPEVLPEMKQEGEPPLRIILPKEVDSRERTGPISLATAPDAFFPSAAPNPPRKAAQEQEDALSP